MKNLNYQDLLVLEKQVINNQNLKLSRYQDYVYDKILTHRDILPEQLWSDKTEMIKDFDYLLANPLIAHWLFEEVGFNLTTLDLTPLQKSLFYQKQTHFFVKALMILVKDSTPTLSEANLELLKANLIQNSAKIS